MKKHTMIGIVAAAMIINIAAVAQVKQATKLDQNSPVVKLNYLAGLRSENEGLSESSMLQTAKIKMLYPTVNFDEMKKVTDSLIVSGKNPSVRYKAYLTSNVYDNPEWFAKRDRSNLEDDEQFFASIAAQLQERILGARAN